MMFCTISLAITERALHQSSNAHQFLMQIVDSKKFEVSKFNQHYTQLPCDLKCHQFFVLEAIIVFM
jgi:hypothetical protein